MSQVLTAVQICELALRAIGEFPVTDSAADGEQLREAMSWLDLYMGQLAGEVEVFSLIAQQLPIPITNGTGAYDLGVALGANLPIDGTQFPIQAWIEYGSPARRYPLHIATRSQFNSTVEPAETGVPRMIYIDRLPDPTLQIYPVPPVNDTTSYTILIDLQTYAPNVGPGGVTGTQPASSTLTKFRQAWQRHLVCQLSHDLGSGPITKIGESSLNRFGKMASEAKAALEAFENREHDDTPPIGDAYDGECFYGHHHSDDRVRH